MDRHGEINSANCVAVGRKESNAGLRSKKLAAIIIYSTLFPPRSFSVYSRFFVSFHPASTLEAWCSVASTVVVACNPILGVLLLGLPRCAPAYWDVVTLAHPLSLSLSRLRSSRWDQEEMNDEDETTSRRAASLRKGGIEKVKLDGALLHANRFANRDGKWFSLLQDESLDERDTEYRIGLAKKYLRFFSDRLTVTIYKIYYILWNNIFYNIYKNNIFHTFRCSNSLLNTFHFKNNMYIYVYFINDFAI